MIIHSAAIREKEEKAHILPCPFCGANAFMWHTNYQTFVQCERFDATSHGRHLIQVSGNTEEEAIKAWNQRKTR